MSGRYAISIDAALAVREQQAISASVIIHDSQNLKIECKIEEIKRLSRFNNLEWAIDRGYTPCEFCGMGDSILSKGD